MDSAYVDHMFIFITYIIPDVLATHSRHISQCSFLVSIFLAVSCLSGSTEDRDRLSYHPNHRLGYRPLAHLFCHVLLLDSTLHFIHLVRLTPPLAPLVF